MPSSNGAKFVPANIECTQSFWDIQCRNWNFFAVKIECSVYIHHWNNVLVKMTFLFCSILHSLLRNSIHFIICWDLWHTLLRKLILSYTFYQKYCYHQDVIRYRASLLFIPASFDVFHTGMSMWGCYFWFQGGMFHTVNSLVIILWPHFDYRKLRCHFGIFDQ